MNGKFCPHCGAQTEEGALVCPNCGKPLKNLQYCPHCGEQIDAEAVICPKCGRQVKQIQAPPAQAAQPNIIITNTNTATANATNGLASLQKSKMVTLLLCLFLGWLGIHRFYVGKMGTGVLWMLTVGLFGIGWLIDLIMIITGAFRDKAGLPLA